jgi:hypothetical protein
VRSASALESTETDCQLLSSIQEPSTVFSLSQRLSDMVEWELREDIHGFPINRHRTPGLPPSTQYNVRQGALVCRRRAARDWANLRSRNPGCIVTRLITHNIPKRLGFLPLNSSLNQLGSDGPGVASGVTSDDRVQTDMLPYVIARPSPPQPSTVRSRLRRSDGGEDVAHAKGAEPVQRRSGERCGARLSHDPPLSLLLHGSSTSFPTSRSHHSTLVSTLL